MLRKWLAGRAGAWTLCLAVGTASRATADRGFQHIFDGATLNGWKLVGQTGRGFYVRDGVLVDPAGEWGNLFTVKTYSDFVFRCDFKLSPGANNGVGIRAPYQGDAAYMGMEIQMLDDSAPRYADLQPWQYHGSIYNVVAAKRGSLKPVGQWNHEEIAAIGRRIRIIVNGSTIVDADLNRITDPATLLHHPGMLRSSGHIGFLGHEPGEVDFKNIWVEDLSKPKRDNRPPAGFTALFDGHDLKAWKALVANPPVRHRMSAEVLAVAQKKANAIAFQHWKAHDGMIVYDGKNDNLCTVRQYRDFEMMVDWKIGPRGDSGIYLRGSPQVQIWDNPIGSGGLYNNQINPSNPLVYADNPIGQWNHYRIVMVGDKVIVYLNGKLVVNAITLENYWERDKPIYRVEQIELQHHGDPLWFKNIYIRDIHTPGG